MNAREFRDVPPSDGDRFAELKGSNAARADGQHVRETSPTEWEARFVERLQQAAGGMTYRQLGLLVDHNPETVRRYLTGATLPGASFLAALCETMDVSADWLLLGRGSMRHADRDADALRRASIPALLARVAEAIEGKARGGADPTRMMQARASASSAVTDAEPAPSGRRAKGRAAPKPVMREAPGAPSPGPQSGGAHEE